MHDEQQQLINDPSHLQDSQTDAGNIEQEYKDAVEAAVADKETQAENLENRLESLIDKQEAVLQQMMSRQPGFLALPGKKAKWQSQVQQQQSLLSRLQNRLETVKEIHDGMGLHGPRLHELATVKCGMINQSLPKNGMKCGPHSERMRISCGSRRKNRKKSYKESRLHH
ncbi:IncP plasmid survival protein KfrC family protein (plasmid) [Escherichia coli]